MRPRALDERGSVTAFVAVIALGLVMVAGMAYDGGQIVVAQATARDIASSAARAGAQEIDIDHLRSTGESLLDPERAMAAAQEFVVRAGFTGTAQVNGDSVTVTVRIRQPMRILPLPDRIVAATDTSTALQQARGVAP